MAVGATSAQAGIGIKDRPIVLQPGPCASAYENSVNQFIWLGTNSPIKWSGGLRSCSTGSQTARVHLEPLFAEVNGCSVAPIESELVPLRSGDIKGLSVQAPEPECEGYYYFQVTAVDANGGNVSPGGGSVTYTVHVAPKT